MARVNWVYRNRGIPKAVMDLNDPAFGRIKICEILGAEPGLEATRQMLEAEIEVLIRNLEGRDVGELRALRAQQLRAHRTLNSRPGAMALPQGKIRLFSDFSSRYVDHIESRLG